MDISKFDLLESYTQKVEDYVISMAKLHWDCGFYDGYDEFVDELKDDNYNVKESSLAKLYDLYNETYDECRAASNDEFYYDMDEEDE